MGLAEDILQNFHLINLSEKKIIIFFFDSGFQSLFNFTKSKGFLANLLSESLYLSTYKVNRFLNSSEEHKILITSNIDYLSFLEKNYSVIICKPSISNYEFQKLFKLNFQNVITVKLPIHNLL